MTRKVNADSFAKEVLQAEQPVLVDFYSDGCVPCKRMAPLLAEIEEQNSWLKVVKVNSAFEQELVQTYDVQAAPTLILFRGGEELGRLRGAAKKPQILELIQKIEE